MLPLSKRPKLQTVMPEPDSVVGSSSDISYISSALDTAVDSSVSSTQNDIRSETSVVETSPTECKTNCRKNASKILKPKVILVDSLTKFFTPSDKRKSRVSLNSLPKAPPEPLVPPESLIPQTVSDNETSQAKSSLESSETIGLIQSSVRESSIKNCSVKGNPMKEGSVKEHQVIKTKKSSVKFFAHTSKSKKTKQSMVHLLNEEQGSRGTNEIVPCLTNQNHEVRNCKISSDKIPCIDKESENSMTSRDNVDTAQSIECPSEVDKAENLNADELKDNLAAKRKRKRKTQLNSLQDSLSHFFAASGEQRKRNITQHLDLMDHMVEQRKRNITQQNDSLDHMVEQRKRNITQQNDSLDHMVEQRKRNITPRNDSLDPTRRHSNVQTSNKMNPLTSTAKSYKISSGNLENSKHSGLAGDNSNDNFRKQRIKRLARNFPSSLSNSGEFLS